MRSLPSTVCRLHGGCRPRRRHQRAPVLSHATRPNRSHNARRSQTHNMSIGVGTAAAESWASRLSDLLRTPVTSSSVEGISVRAGHCATC